MRRAGAALCLACMVLASCTAVRRPQRPAPAAAAAIIDALARRERAARGLRLSMTVRLAGTGQDALLPSPAYLAIDDGGAIRLQVLSPFGITVLDLAIRGDAYILTLPLRHDTRQGTIDFRALADPAVAVSDRMIVALALMFRPKARRDACSAAAPATVACRLGGSLAARVTVDEALRPVREEYLDDGGRPLLAASFADYRGDDPAAVAGSLVIDDPTSGARMTIRVTRARIAAATPS